MQECEGYDWYRPRGSREPVHTRIRILVPNDECTGLYEKKNCREGLPDATHYKLDLRLSTDFEYTQTYPGRFPSFIVDSHRHVATTRSNFLGCDDGHQ